MLIKPHHANTLLPLLLDDEELIVDKKHAKTLPKVFLNSREANDLIMMGIGGFTPLTGFMGYEDWHGVCADLQTADGIFWPIPITLSTDHETASSIREGDEVALVEKENQLILGTMKVTEKYWIDKAYECQQVYGVDEDKHPGVCIVKKQGEINLAGPVKVHSTNHYEHQYTDHFLTPFETRELFTKNNWQTIAAFQTRNPMHRAHEHLSKVAMEVCDGVLIHSLLGNLKQGDIPADVRTKAIDILVEKYFEPNTVVHGGYPLDMRYAGPREALLHALFRQNYGCTHIIIGRDHAGVSDYYGAYDAQNIFDQIPTDALQIQAIKLDWHFWCTKCLDMVSEQTCPHGPAERIHISGTRLREMLSKGEQIPQEFSRPEVLEILKAYYQSKP